MRLTDFDPRVVDKYSITANDLRRVERYLRLLQGPDAPTLPATAGPSEGSAAMIVKYRVIEDWLADEGIWYPWGMFYENCSGMFPERTLLTRAIPDDDRRKARYFGQRIERFCPTVEEAETVLGKYADRYRVLPEIRTVEGASYKEIRARLWDAIFEEMKKRQPERRVEYVMPERAYVALRESPEELTETESPQ